MSASPRRVSLALAASLFGLAAALTACAGASDRSPDRALEQPGEMSPGISHVHGLGRNPGDDVLYVASHYGVFRVESGNASRVADRFQDTMGFVIVGPDRFMASGHPDLREDLPTHLGLLESTDAAHTWTSLSMSGEADFHAMDVAGNTLYAYDGLTERLMATSDRRSWSVLMRRPLIDLAAHPSVRDLLLVTTPQLEVLAAGSDGSATPLPTAPPTAYIDWQGIDTLVGLGPDGAVHVSKDRGASWRKRTSPGGEPQAVEVSSQRWDVATSDGIFTSTDQGRTWQRVVATS